MSKKFNISFAVTLALLTVCFSVLPSAAYADDKTYSNVLEDLGKDSSFSAANYPTKSGDYSLRVIQLAESEDKELFVYVYQPSGTTKDFTASSINISTTINDAISYNNYKLQRLSSSGTLYKYLVQNFTVKTDTTRYYAISSIYRPFDETIDTQASGDNTVTEVTYEVAKQYCFSVINGNPYVSVVDIETIVVTDKFVGFVRYDDGYLMHKGACDSHFVAFSTDKKIENLLEADVYYTYQSFSYDYLSFVRSEETYGDKMEETVTLTGEKVTHTGGGLFAGTYTWERIETVEQFIANTENYTNVYSGVVFDVSVGNKITDAAKKELESKEWVLRFCETDYYLQSSSSGAVASTTVRATLVGDVTILRLKFETDGVTYNLGVIDNKQTGSSEPINKQEVKVEVNERGKWILAILALILLIVLLFPILPHILNAIFFVISLPFKLLGKLFKGIKRRRDVKKAEKDLQGFEFPPKEEIEKRLDEIDWESDFWKDSE